jgi:uncharacterized membrane protein
LIEPNLPYWIGGGVAGFFTIWKLVSPVVQAIRDMRGKGSDPSLRQLVELTASNSTLIVEDVTTLKGEAKKLRDTLNEHSERLERVEKLTGIKPLQKVM